MARRVGSACARGRGAAAARAAAFAQPLDGPNVTTERDLAAGALVDSFFDPIAPVDPLPARRRSALGVEPSKASVRPQWTARLARNPKPNDGNPPFVLIDRYGGIQRYVEPVPQIDLDATSAKRSPCVATRATRCLATQLDLPRSPARAARKASTGGVDELAAFEEPLPAIEPTPADERRRPTDGHVDRRGRGVKSWKAKIIEGDGPMFDDKAQPMIMPEGVDPLYLERRATWRGCATCGSEVCGALPGRLRLRLAADLLRPRRVPAVGIRRHEDAAAGGRRSQPDDAIFDHAFVVYGNEEILDGRRSGGRVTLGYWLDDYGQRAIEGDYLASAQIDFIAGTSIDRRRLIGTVLRSSCRPSSTPPPDVPAVAVEEVVHRRLTRHGDGRRRQPVSIGRHPPATQSVLHRRLRDGLRRRRDVRQRRGRCDAAAERLSSARSRHACASSSTAARGTST